MLDTVAVPVRVAEDTVGLDTGTVPVRVAEDTMGVGHGCCPCQSSRGYSGCWTRVLSLSE